MATSFRVIHLRPDAPVKPALGAACTGCGVCCALEPCPLGRLLSLKWRGQCRMLKWQAGRYVCGAMEGPRWTTGMVRRWIAAGHGCDAAVSIQPLGPGSG